jgi:FKBP-type peptidyl-prolyl cis-trans isomerase
MKKFAVIALAFPLCISLFAQDKPVQLKDDKDKASYAIGLNIGTNLKHQDVELNGEALMAGFRDGMSGKKPQLSDEEAREAMMGLQKNMQQKQQVTADKNKADGEKFLAENKNKPGVKTTASGLQYKVEQEGKGAAPKLNDMVSVNYRGTFIDGTEFDASRGQPISFPVSGVISGWTEALQLMKPGAKYQLFIPSKLAYGERGNRGIPPNSTLIFEVELLEVKPNAAAGASPSPSAK